MAIPKRNGGRLVGRGREYIIWAFLLTLLGLMLFQMSGSAHRVSLSDAAIHVTPGKFREESATEDVMDARDDPPWLREMLKAVDLCRTSTKAAANGSVRKERVQTFGNECREKLLMSHQSLNQTSSMRPPPASCDHGRASRDSLGNDKSRVEALEDEVATLGAMLDNSTVFLELKDTKQKGLDSGDTPWFMSSISGPLKREAGAPEELEFPSELSLGRLLCLEGNSRQDGTKNRYGFAWKGHLPPNATLLQGITFVTENYWDYQNIWHAMSTLVSFVAWRGKNGCAVPERLLLYHWGELVPSMGSWMGNLLHATFGRALPVERLEYVGNPVVCLERAVVNRRGLQGMSIPNLNALFDTVRCRARRFCGIVPREHAGSGSRARFQARVVLLLRSGARSFTNDSAVIGVVGRVCEELSSCHVDVAYADKLNFCDQVALMSKADILITTHGAQLTNSMFMNKGSSIMEFMPKGWLETAGVGQYIYMWLADWSNLHHEGQWRDPEGPDCPFPQEETLNCLLFFKDRQVGLNATNLAEWTRAVVGNFTQRNFSEELPPSNDCACASMDSMP